MLIVQNNTGLVANANSYVSMGNACNYLAGRVNLPSYTDEQIENAVLSAMSELESVFPFKGEKFAGEAQTTKFPRYTEEVLPSPAEIPNKIKDAVCEYAIYFLTSTIGLVGYTPADSYRDTYTKLVADPVAVVVLAIEVELADGKLYVSMGEDDVYRSEWILPNT